jgi:hypothetical protein
MTGILTVAAGVLLAAWAWNNPGPVFSFIRWFVITIVVIFGLMALAAAM